MIKQYSGIAIFLVVAIVWSALSILRIDSLHSSFFDYGLLLNNLYQISNHGLYIAFIGHIKPLLIPIAYFSDLFPTSVSLYIPVLIQSLVLAIPVILLYKEFGAAIAIAYILYFPLWFIVLFDFHIDSFIVLLNTLFFISFYQKKYKNALCYALLFPLVKEVYAVHTIAAGFLFLFRFGKVKYFAVLVILGIVYLIISLEFVLPYFTETSITKYFENSFEALYSFNINDILKTVFSTKKIVFILVFFVPFLFLSLLRPLPLIMAAPIFLIALLSDNQNHSSYAAHYSAGLVIPIIFSFALYYRESIHQYSIVSKKILMLILIVVQLSIHYYISISPVSRLFNSDKIWRYSQNAYVKTDRDREIIKATQSHITNIDNSVSIQNNLNPIWVTQRETLYPFPDSITPSLESKISAPSLLGLFKFIGFGVSPSFNHYFSQAEFILLDKKRPLFIYDKGCEWVYGSCTDEEIIAMFYKINSELTKDYEKIFSHDGFEIWKLRALILGNE